MVSPAPLRRKDTRVVESYSVQIGEETSSGRCLSRRCGAGSWKVRDVARVGSFESDRTGARGAAKYSTVESSQFATPARTGRASWADVNVDDVGALADAGSSNHKPATRIHLRGRRVCLPIRIFDWPYLRTYRK